MAAAVGVEHGHAVGGLLAVQDAGGGVQLDAAVRLHAVEQRLMHVGAMDHRVGVAEAGTERVAERNLGDRAGVGRVQHHHAVVEDGAAARLLADAERVEGGEGVRRELDAGADLADLGGLLEHLDREAAPRQGERGGEAADAAAGDEDGPLGAHVSRGAARARDRAPAAPAGRRS
jgi:hypothetical protein